jgi:hypothetical protein
MGLLQKLFTDKSGLTTTDGATPSKYPVSPQAPLSPLNPDSLAQSKYDLDGTTPDKYQDKVESNLFSTLSATNKGSIYDPSKISTYSTTKTTSILKDSLVDTFLDIEDGKTPSKYIDNKPR